MARRRVTKSGKNGVGNITKLCSSESWAPRSKEDVIKDIEGGLHTYFVDAAGYETTVNVVNRNGTKHLQTTADTTSKNNLDNLPDC